MNASRIISLQAINASGPRCSGGLTEALTARPHGRRAQRVTCKPLFAQSPRRRQGETCAMANDYFREVPKLHPVDKQAAIVTSRGVRFRPRKQIFHLHMEWRDVPLPTSPYPSRGNPLVLPVGFRAGRLVVVGYGRTTSGKGARWVVRCDCGAYGHQRYKWLTSEAAKTKAMCPACDHLAELRNDNSWCEP